jgi:hypothetical protein
MPGKYSCTTPGTQAYPVTPSDSVDLNPSARSLYIGVTGDVAIITVDGQTVIFKNHPVGYMPMQASRVKLTGTTAEEILALV